MTRQGDPAATRLLTAAERFDWLRLLRCDTIGPRSFIALIQRFGTAAAALEALPDLAASARAGRPIAIAGPAAIEHEMEALHRCGAVLVGLYEPDYPPLLRQIHAPPPLLAVRGAVPCLQRSMVAVVGSRNASAAGLAFTEQIARGLGRAGHVIVSGLARGIDARAHQAALETGTVAVLAGGLGNIYPADHAGLLERLLEHGAAISEMPFGWEARGRDFPRRNRIVAGLARGVVVIEAARRSGSLITAGFAADQGREIFAVPGSPLDPRAEGANDLLRDGATFCTSAEDVVEALARQNPSLIVEAGFAEPHPAAHETPFWDELELPGLDGVVAQPAPQRPAATPPADLFADAAEDCGPTEAPCTPLTREAIAARVVELLGPTPVSVDEIARTARAPARAVRTILFELELAGRLERHGADLVSKIG